MANNNELELLERINSTLTKIEKNIAKLLLLLQSKS